jgi:heme exporter protein D
MIELGPHASFILAAYGVTFVAIAGLVLVTVGDDQKQRRLLAELERQGIKRRSAAKAPPKTAASKPARAAKTPAAKRKTAAKPRARKTPS